MQDNNKFDNDKVTVKIYNNEYPLKGVKDPQQIYQVAEQIERRMREIAESASYLTSDRLAVLVALEFGEKMATLQKDYEELWNLVNEYKNED